LAGGVLLSAGLLRAAATFSLAGGAPVAHPTRGLLMTDATPAATPNDFVTVMLVHGAFADGGSWGRVIGELQAAGIAAVAVANPLRGLSADAAYVASAAGQIPGPVLLAGHSYGGAVITVAAPQASNVVGLVYVAAFAPAAGESVLDIIGGAPPTLLGAALRPAAYPTGDPAAPGTEFTIAMDQFAEVFAADLPAAEAAVLAVSQRPAADIGFGEPAAAAGWETLPSWFVISTADQAINPVSQRANAERAGSTIIDVDASHAVALSQPAAVARVIADAVAGVA
jgi:pimeloyl-ACP methyl ester carboxylesterase